MVTDRRRSGADWRSELPKRVAAAAHAGVDLVQVRERDLDGGPLLTLVRDCVAAVAGTSSRVLVNDRVDIALAAGAHGVHLRGDSFGARRVRAIAGRPLLVGRSVHSAEEAAAVDDVDYLLFGTVFPTASKAGRDAAGPAGLRAAAAAAAIPVLAIGGISLDTVSDVGRTGAAGVAAIGLFANCEWHDLYAIAAQARFLFDSPRAGSLT